MDLIQRTTKSIAYDSDDWLVDRHGLDCTETITVDTTAFTAGTHYAAVSGVPNELPFIPRGTPVKVSGTGANRVYVPAANADTTADGYLRSSVRIPATGNGRVGAALLWHGHVYMARLNNTFAPNALPPNVRHKVQ